MKNLKIILNIFLYETHDKKNTRILTSFKIKSLLYFQINIIEFIAQIFISIKNNELSSLSIKIHAI